VAATRALAALAEAGVTHTVHDIPAEPGDVGYARAAAAALGVDEERVFKTLVAMVDGFRAVVAVVPASGQLSLKAIAAAAGAKRAEMAQPALAERLTGYVVGGISPIGQKHQLPTFVDETAMLFDTIFVSAGRRGLDVELAPDDLLALTGGTYAAIATAR
jgi:Cys-tRNA(Pro)/Cys-tRNA(Cys) deacylase